MNVRRERVAESIKQETSEILREMKDPRIGLASVVSVEVSKDVRHAKVFVSVYGSESEQAESFQALGRARGFVRSELARRIHLRYIPDLQFVPDDSIAHSVKIAGLLRDLNQDGEGRQKESGSEE
ncbi:MAG: 30S ribosome-binding factor RbfA [Thermaerobacterales bacterium]